jgi:signal transduction histidine kinase
LSANIVADVAAISRIAAVPTILEVICRTTGMGFAAVARVTDAQWVACAVRDEISFGLSPGGELELRTTICDEIRGSGSPVVIDHVAAHDTYRNHGTPARYGFQSYISVPIFRPSGSFFGTLCAIDPRPARVDTPEVVGMFRLFADLIGFHLDANERLEASQTALTDERRTAELREQFIAVLGHDLRNPLASIGAAIRLLRREPLAERARTVLDLAHNSVVRISGLIENVLDFARGRLGDGIQIEPRLQYLQPALDQVVDELRAAWPDRVVETRFELGREIRCDAPRVAQLLSNLLANALAHGAPGSPVGVDAQMDRDTLEIAVANEGEPIPPAVLGRLFEPFSRASAGPGQQGLGLGLYIAAEIARAHGGTLAVSSTPPETRFTFRMPLAGQVAIAS